jgi:integrase
MMVLDTTQCLRLLDVAKGRRLEALFVLAVTTGMREGELLALHWCDVDLSRGAVAVTGTLSRSRVGLEITDPKTARARRQILLTAQAVQALQRHRLVQARTRLAAGSRWVENDLVFPTVEGRPMDTERLLRRHFAPLLRDAGLAHMRFHDLRHTAATQMLLRGVHPRVVADILGHSDPAITMRVYSHVVPAMHDQAARAMESLFHAGGQPPYVAKDLR